MQRHRHQEFIRFLNAVEKTVPATKAMHVILDNYAPSALPLHSASLGGASGRLRPQAPEGDRLARPPPARHLSLHPDQRLLAERRRRLLRRPDQAQAPAGCLPRRRRPPGRHQPLARRAQRRTEAVPLESRPRRHYRRRSPRTPDVGFNPLGSTLTKHPCACQPSLGSLLRSLLDVGPNPVNCGTQLTCVDRRNGEPYVAREAELLAWDGADAGRLSQLRYERATVGPPCSHKPGEAGEEVESPLGPGTG